MPQTPSLPGHVIKPNLGLDTAHVKPTNEMYQAGTILGTSRHPKSERFHEILKELGELHDRKQQDYGQPGDPFANITASREWGIAPHIGSLLRMNDKVQRLKAWAVNGHLANEGAEDSIRDIAVYAIIALVQLEFQETYSPSRPPA